VAAAVHRPGDARVEGQARAQQDDAQVRPLKTLDRLARKLDLRHAYLDFLGDGAALPI
jgi:hypothetical protein